MNRPRISRRLFLGAPIALAVGAAGCDSLAEDALVIATSWSESDCQKVASGFTQWSSLPSERLDRPTRLHWVRLHPGDDPARLGDTLRGIDVVLGGPIASYKWLAAMGGLASIENQPAWKRARRVPIGIAVDPRAFASGQRKTPAAWADLQRAEFSGQVALGDFRTDPVALALATSILSAHWSEGYGELVRLAANAPRILTADRSARSEILRGRATLGPSLSQSHDFVLVPGGATLTEGVGILREARDLERASSFLRHFPPISVQTVEELDFRSEALLAELLGATLVDAHEELRIAWSVLSTENDPSSIRTLLSPPSWPPAIVGRLRASKNTASLVETLAEQIASRPADRSWLLESWNRPERAIDGAWISELAAVEGGRLADDAKFRAWLRSEWTAWARKRYRTLSRSAENRRS